MKKAIAYGRISELDFVSDLLSFRFAYLMSRTYFMLDVYTPKSPGRFGIRRL